ncbi:MAG TPA: Gfo/Idh/MocA family oxidoreductase [Polyangiaceae bacterium]|jgi:predicted dehydrogenase|nr:Gfo/Idh/MocA family oxidoreductase [Polyangiaceae bacterium]
MTARVRIGVIGTGQIAQKHFAAYAKIPEVELVACADLNADAAQKSAAEYGIPNVYTQYQELLKRDDLDAVDVCLHNNLHRPVTVAGLEAGKHVYCEKPMAGSYADARAMWDAAQRTGKKLHIQLATLFANETRAAKELIDLGELGELYHARSSSARRRGRPYVDGYGTANFVQKAHAAGGALYDMGVYHIAQLLYLLGNPGVERVTGKTYQHVEMDAARRARSQYDVEELAAGFVRLTGGATLDIIEAWALHVDSLEASYVFGSKAGVRLHPFGFFKSYGHLNLDAGLDLASAKIRWDSVTETGKYYAGSQQHWVGALLGHVPLFPTAEIALTTMLISEGLYLSESLGREVTAEEIKQHSRPASS